MKKIYLMAAFLGAGVFAFGQSGDVQQTALKKLNLEPIKSVSNSGHQKAAGDVLWHENFDSIVYVMDGSVDSLSMPSADFWTIDNDGLTGNAFGWAIGDVDYGWWGSGDAFNSSSGGNYAQVNNGDPTATPATQELNKTFTLTSNPINVDSLANGAEVLLTFEQTGALFNDSQFLEISLDGITWIKVYDNKDVKSIHAVGSSNPYPNPDLVELDLSTHIPSGQGAAVQLRFGWTSAFPTEVNPIAWVTYGWVIDDVKIVVKPAYDLVFVSADHHFANAQYSQIPDDQVSEMEIKVLFYNLGSNDLTGVTLNLMDGSNVVASGTLGHNLEPSKTDSITITYTPGNAIGVQTYTLELETTETDENPTNNVISYEIKFDVNANTYAADKLNFGEDALEYELGIELTTGPVQYESVGVQYDMYANKEATGIDIRFEGGVDNEVIVGIQLVAEEVTPIAESEVYMITAADIGKVISIPLETRTVLAACNTYRAYINGFSNPEVTIASSGETSQPAQIMFYDGQGNYSYITNLYDIPVIRLNFDPTLSIASNEMSTLNVTQYPNPFANETTVSFSLEDASNVSYTIVDVTGKVIATADKGQLMAGDHEFNIDGTSFANGIYYLNLKADNASVTHRLVVNK